MSINILITFE